LWGSRWKSILPYRLQVLAALATKNVIISANEDDKILSTSPKEKKSKRKLLSMIIPKKLKFWSICTCKKELLARFMCYIVLYMISYLIWHLGQVLFFLDTSFWCYLQKSLHHV
jgi:hypothetical protein